MAERFLDCRNLAGYFYKWWQTTLGEAQDASYSKQREAEDRAIREANGFKHAYSTARKWLYEHTDVPEANIHALIERRHGGSSIPIAPARLALEALDERGDNLKLLAFMWEHHPAQCTVIELPRPAKPSERSRRNMSKADRERIALEKYDQLWRFDNQSKWAEEVGCDRKYIPSLEAWTKAAQRREKWDELRLKGEGIVSREIIEACYAGDASVLGRLTVRDRDNLDAKGDEERSEFIRLLQEAAFDAENHR